MPRLGEPPRGKSPMLAFRVVPETLELLKALAKKRGVTVSQYARDCLEKCLAQGAKA